MIDGGSPSVTGGVIFGGDSGDASSGNIVEHNVIGDSTRYNIESWWGGAVGSGNVARSNCVFGGGMGDIGATNGFAPQSNLVADPLFVSRAGTRLPSSRRQPVPCGRRIRHGRAPRLGPTMLRRSPSCDGGANAPAPGGSERAVDYDGMDARGTSGGGAQTT